MDREIKFKDRFIPIHKTSAFKPRMERGRDVAPQGRIQVATAFKPWGSIGKGNYCFVVAEAGSNHNGDIELGKRLIKSAKECGCDAVKFQAFKTEALVTKRAAKAEYQKGKSSGKSQFEMLKDLEFSAEAHRRLVEYADSIGIPIFYSVFDKHSADLVEQLEIDIFKLGSGELTNIPLIKYIAKKDKPLILSTGMGTDQEIQDAVDAFRGEGNEQLILMNCSTGYPSRPEDANLKRIDYLAQKFEVPCGSSDHSEGIVVSVIAAVMGAPIIEKHFTIDKGLPGPDQAMSMEPKEMKRLCELIRMVEKNPVREEDLLMVLEKVDIKISRDELQRFLGQGERGLSEIEARQRIWARKSIVAARDINKGEVLSSRNLDVMRPEEGILPGEMEKVLGRRLKSAVVEGTPIKWDMLR